MNLYESFIVADSYFRRVKMFFLRKCGKQSIRNIIRHIPKYIQKMTTPKEKSLVSRNSTSIFILFPGHVGSDL